MKTGPMRHVFFVIVGALLISNPMSAASDVSQLTDSQLVDALTAVDAPVPGVAGMADFGGFIAEDKPLHFRGGVLGVAPPAVPAAMRELVRRGPAALPELLKHLRDARTTKLAVGEGSGGFFMFQYFSNEYLEREPKKGIASCSQRCLERAFAGSYAVKVGDICFVIVGQIVNRNLQAVRYQPTAGLVVNSPIEVPELADRLWADWHGVDSEGLKAALLADLHRKVFEGGAPTISEDIFQYPALARLRFYYPATYAGLSGADLKKREAFESQEAKERRGAP